MQGLAKLARASRIDYQSTLHLDSPEAPHPVAAEQRPLKNTKQQKRTMNKQPLAINNDKSTLGEESRALMAATAEVAGEQVTEARNRLAAALESGKQILGRVKERAVEGAKATDECAHEHPYEAIGVALGVGALIGYLIARRSSRNGG
jgi:ElaB/YqjD/DUF883 family membrane-anchored ribosome-binding protein